MSTREPRRLRRVRFRSPIPDPPATVEPVDDVYRRPIPPFVNHDAWDVEEVIDWAWAIFQYLAVFAMSIYMFVELLKFCIWAPSYIANTNFRPQNPFVSHSVARPSAGNTRHVPLSTVQLGGEDDDLTENDYTSFSAADAQTYDMFIDSETHDIFSHEIPTIIDDSFTLSDDLPPTTRPPMFTFGHGTDSPSVKTYTLVTDESYLKNYPLLTERPLPTPENAWDIPITSADPGSPLDGPITNEESTSNFFSSAFTGSLKKTLPITTIGKPWPNQMPWNTIRAFYEIVGSASNLTVIEALFNFQGATLQFLRESLGESKLKNRDLITSQIVSFRENTKSIATEVNSYLMLVSMTEDYLHTYLDKKTTVEQKLHAYGAVGFLRYLMELQAKSLLQVVQMAQDDLIETGNILRRSNRGPVKYLVYTSEDEDAMSDIKFGKFYLKNDVSVFKTIWNKIVPKDYFGYDKVTLAQMENLPRKLRWQISEHLKILHAIGEVWEDSTSSKNGGRI